MARFARFTHFARFTRNVLKLRHFECGNLEWCNDEKHGKFDFLKSQKNQSWLRREAKIGWAHKKFRPKLSLNLASEENQDIDLVTSSSSQKVRWKVFLAQKKVMLLSSRRVSISGLWKVSRPFFNARRRRRGWVRRLLFPYPWHWRVPNN